MSIVTELDYDTTAAEQKLEEIEQKRENAEVAISNVISMARTAYMTTVNVVRAAGGTVSTLFQSILTVGFSAVSILYPLISAKAVIDPFSAAIGLVNLGLAVTSLIAAQMKQTEVARRLNSAQMALHGISNLLGSLDGFL